MVNSEEGVLSLIYNQLISTGDNLDLGLASQVDGWEGERLPRRLSP